MIVIHKKVRTKLLQEVSEAYINQVTLPPISQENSI